MYRGLRSSIDYNAIDGSAVLPPRLPGSLLGESQLFMSSVVIRTENEEKVVLRCLSELSLRSWKKSHAFTPA